MIVYFADRQLSIIGQASTKLPNGLKITEDLTTEDVETGVAVFECKVPFNAVTRTEAEFCTEVGNYILVRSNDENKLFTIIDSELDTDAQEIYIYAEDGGMDLLNEVFGAYEADKAYPISHYINMYASRAGFKIGINEASKLSRKLSWDGESTAAERIASVATQFDGCEVSYSFEVEGLAVTGKYINIYKERGKDIGTPLRLNKDIRKIVVSKSIGNLATALRCEGGIPKNGEEPITLQGYSYDDGDFYVDGKVLKSRVALKRWNRYLWKNEEAEQSGGHIERPYTYDTDSQATLCAHAITELKKIRDIAVNYEAEIVKLADNTKVGDRIYIVDDAGELYLSTRLLKLESSESEDTHNATLGEFLIKSSGISEKVSYLASQFSATAKSATMASELARNAFSSAETAYLAATDAQAAADAAQQRADAAAQGVIDLGGTVGDATESANKASFEVEEVREMVAALQKTVDDAQLAADNARLAADTAQEKADEAATAAANALADAADAKAETVIAQEKATTATEKAATAQTTAETAKTKAETANATAEAARLDAEKAQQDIDNLGAELETVSQTMSADYARKTDLTETTASLQSQISQNAEEISSNVARIATVDETANNAKEQAQTAQSVAGTAKAQAEQAAADALSAQTAADNAATAAANAQNEADTAKAAATAAKSVADKAESDLAAAKADLETVSSRVGVTEEDIASAQAAVESAQAAANKAKEDALSATENALEAQEKANNAVSNANDAQSVANDAASKAIQAQKVADEAKGNASSAIETAAQAASVATQAQNVANNAKTTAENAQAVADQAVEDAAAAQEAANSAGDRADKAAEDLETAKQNLANVTARVGATEEEVAAAQEAVNTAQAAADRAKEEAEAAQATADTAKANAATAQTTADNAKTAADTAQRAADSAQQAADDAQAAVDALAIRVTTAETSISQTNEQISLMAKKTEVTQTLGGYYTKAEADAAINVSADSVKSTVGSTYATKQEVKNIEVGGRNYIRHGKGDVKDGFFTNFPIVENGYGELTLTSKKNYTNISIAPGFVLGCRDYEPGKQVVFSYDIMFTAWDFPEGTTTNEWWIGQRYTGGTAESSVGAWRGVTNQVQPPKVGVNGCVLNEWFHVSNVMTIPEPAHESIGTTASIQFYNSNADVAASMTFRIKNVKLEYGNKETDWTPAPEDLDTAVNEAQTTANQASQSATEANERITTAESLIQQLSNSIAMLVTDENGESLMTQTENGWTFSMKETSEAVSSLTTLLETLQQQTGSTQATVSVLQQAINDHGATLDYVSIGSYEEEPCIELGESDNDFKVLITNTRVMFRHGASVPTLINTDGIVTQDIEVKGKVVQGGFTMMNTADGGWGLLWIGGNS